MRLWKTDRAIKQGVVILVHGFGEHTGRYVWLRERWLEVGYHVISGDLPGHGRHPGTRGHVDSFDEYIETVYKWSEAARIHELPVYLLGHSMGGLAVIRTIEEKQPKVDGVILSSPCLSLVNEPPTWLKRIARLIEKIYPKFQIRTKGSADNKHATTNNEVLKRDTKDSLMLKKVSVRWYFELEKAMEEAFKRCEAFASIPLLVLQAGDDRIVDKESVSDWFNCLSIPNKHYKEWPNYYHEVFNEPDRQLVFDYTIEHIKTAMKK